VTPNPRHTHTATFMATQRTGKSIGKLNQRPEWHVNAQVETHCLQQDTFACKNASLKDLEGLHPSHAHGISVRRWSAVHTLSVLRSRPQCPPTLLVRSQGSSTSAALSDLCISCKTTGRRS